MKLLRKYLNEKVMLVVILAVAAILRFYDLPRLPNGLYWDEMDVGYQAYSFLQTGRDYYGNFLPIHFHSFADWRVPLLIYATIPSVALLGLTPLAVRLPVAVFGILSIWLLYLVARELTGKKRVAMLAALVLALSPWHIQYSRMTFESTLLLSTFLLGIFGFFRGLRNPKWLVVSAAGFGLAPWSYNTAKLFIPLILLVLAFIFRKELLSINRKRLLTAIFIFALIVAPLFFGTILAKGGQRFTEVLAFTDPTIGDEIDRRRLEFALASGREREVGLETRTVEKLAHNKPLFWLGLLTRNYLQPFSTEFLFLQGDPNLRHSPKNVGQMYPIEAAALILGIVALVLSWDKLGKKGVFLAAWLLLAPLPAAITFDGGMHATRLFLLLPALVILVALGVDKLITSFTDKRLRLLTLTAYAGFWFLGFWNFGTQYFIHYRWQSAEPFHYNFDKIARLAREKEDEYQQVVVDAHKEWVLMAYLFSNKIEPAFFQRLHPLPVTEFAELETFKINSSLFVFPGERSWRDLFGSQKLSENTLYIVSADQFYEGVDENTVRQRLKDPNWLLEVFKYPDGEVQFIAVERMSKELEE